MSGGGGNWTAEAVRERKLRPLYDLLDAGNIKKVLSEADKLLKKVPTFTCAKVFKGLANLRLGHVDAAVLLAEEAFNDHPSDESTLHAMQILYRELDMPHKVCSLYENACKKEKSEEFLTCLFMAYVRVLDYQKQYQIAIDLYKTFHKGAYLAWAVMSLLVKSKMSDNEKVAQGITLPLAAKMMEKYMKEISVYVEPDILLYWMVLFEMGDYKKAWAVLKSSERRDVDWNDGDLEHLKLTTLAKVDDKDEGVLFEAMENYIRMDPDNYKKYLQYMGMVGDRKFDRVQHFFQHAAFDSNGDITHRSAVLALITYVQGLFEKNIECDLTLHELFICYLQKFFEKPFLIRDLKSVVKHLQRTNKIHLISKECGQLLQALVGENVSVARTIQRTYNLVALDFFINRASVLKSPCEVVNVANEFFRHYLAAKDQFRVAGLQPDLREASPFENYLVTLCVMLMETAWINPGFWTGYYSATAMKQLVLKDKDALADDKTASHNGILPQNCQVYEATEVDFPILLALGLLEFGLTQTPHCYPLRLLLGKMYYLSGAAAAGLGATTDLEIKHMQIDSMGYLYLTQTLVSGDISNAFRVLNYADAFYSTHAREHMEHVISAYKHLNWRQIFEFTKFRQSILSSSQANLVKVERLIWDYTMNGNSQEEIIQIAQKEQPSDMTALKACALVDNRDFSMHSFMFNSDVPQHYAELTFKDSVQRVKIRAGLLIMLSNLIRVANYDKEDELSKYLLEKARDTSYAVHDLIAESTLTEYDANVCLCGPFPPTMPLYIQSGWVNLIQRFVGIIIYCVQDDHSYTDLFGLMKETGIELDKKTNAFIEDWKLVESNIKALNTLTQQAYMAVETFGFLSILSNVLKSFFEKKAPSGTAKSKGKKKQITTEVPWIAEFESLVEILVKSMKKVEKELASFKFASGRWLPTTWSASQQSFWTDKVSTEIAFVLQTHLPIVYQKLDTSYNKTFSEMKTNVHRKCQFAETLLRSNVNLKVTS